MIIITGTKRSGTSMWMQILRAAGIPTIGAAFAKVWKETIEDANRRGFYESRYRRGIYYATNPHPETGVWLRPKETRDLGVKVFVPGVLRSDVIYLSRVVASVRPFRQYAASLTRLYEMEKKNSIARGRGHFISDHMDPVLEWWLENFLLVRDLTTRRYPARLVSYEAILENPEGICREIFNWIGVGDSESAALAIHPEDRTQKADDSGGVSHRFEDVFDEYHRRIKEGVAFDQSFLRKMNETHEALLPEIEAALEQLTEKARERRERIEAWVKERAERGEEVRSSGRKSPPLDPDRLDALLHPIRAAAESRGDDSSWDEAFDLDEGESPQSGPET